MKKCILAVALAVAIGGFANFSMAADKPAPEDGLSLLRANIRMDKREFVKAAMNLSEKDGAKFWSIYHQYEADLMKLNDRREKLIEDYAANFDTMTEDKAGQLAKEAFDLQKSRTSLVESYYKKIAKATSNKVAVRFAQLESVTNAALDVNIGASIPLMPKQ